MRKEMQYIIKCWVHIRWFTAVVLFTIGLLNLGTRELIYPNMVFFGAFAGIVVLNIMFQIHHGLRSGIVTVFQIIADIVFSTIIVHLTGGMQSSFLWIYIIGIITASLTIPRTGGIITALISSMALLVTILLYEANLLIPSEPQLAEFPAMIIHLLSFMGLFSGVAIISNFVSDKLIDHTERFETMNAELESLRAEVAADRETIHTNSAELDLSRSLVTVAEQISHIDHDLNTPLCIISLSIGRVKKIGMESGNDVLQKSCNEITEAINKMSLIMMRLVELKKHPLIKQKTEGNNEQ